MPPTSGFTLAALPKAPAVPARIGSIDAREMYDTIRAGLLAAEQTRSATGKAMLADEQIRTGISQEQMQRDVIPTLTQATVTDTPLRSRLLATQVGEAEAMSPLKQRGLLAQTRMTEAKADIAEEEAKPEFIEARMKRMLMQLTPTGVREFEALTKDLTPAEKEKALRIHLGLTGRASGAAIQYKTVIGEDGRERLVAVDPRSVGAHVIGSGETYGSGVGAAATPAGTGATATQPAGTSEPAAQTGTSDAAAATATTAKSPFVSQTPGEKKTEEVSASKTQEILLENRAKLPKARASLETMEGKTKLVEETIDKAIKDANYLTTGWAGALKALPATDARKLAGLFETIRSNIGFDALAEMRQNSPTGGAVGNVSDQENKLLSSTIAALDQLQSKEDVREALVTIKQARREALTRIRNAYERDEDRYGERTNPNAGSGTGEQVGRFKIIEVK